jgi:hypothetical protein
MVAPDRRDGGGDHRAAVPGTQRRRLADEVVDAERCTGDRQQRREFLDIRRVVGEEVALHEAERLRIVLDDEDIGRVDAVDRRAEVVFDRRGRRIVIPPARDVRFAEPAGEQRIVAAREPAERDGGTRGALGRVKASGRRETSTRGRFRARWRKRAATATRPASISA